MAGEKKEKEIKENKENKRKLKLNFDIKKLINFQKLKLNLKRLRYNKKVFMIIIISLIIIIGVVSFFIFINSNQNSKVTKMIKSKELSVIVPQDAFNSEKKFIIEEIPENSIEYQNLVSLGNFYGKIYNVKPEDGKEESSLIPLKVRYKIPPNLYFGDNFINFTLGYSSDGEPPIVSEFSGARVIKENNTYYLEAETFHLSKIGLIVKSPQESDYGMKTLIEKPVSIEPDVLLIPGTDLNFTGYLSNTSTSENPYGNNFWSVLFPKRSIWEYKYPMIDTKSKVYYDSYLGYLIRTGSKSFIEFEAKRLAQQLKRFPNKEFDIVAHGIGGLIARYAIESDKEINNVKNIVLISTPNKGTNLANPIFYNLFYGKNSKLLSNAFNISEQTAINISYNTNFFLEQINSYYEDIMPNSKFLNQLNSYGKNENTRYLAIAGNNPKMSKELSNSSISKIYPEFLNSKGDGVVSVESALLENADKNLLYSKNFYEMYSNPDVLDSIKRFLNESVEKIEIKDFQDDDFIETYTEKEAKEKIIEENYRYFKLPEQYNEENILTNLNTLSKINTSNSILRKIGNKILIETEQGIYSIYGEKIFDSIIKGGVVYNNRYYVSTDTGIYVSDDQNDLFLKISDETKNADEIYYIPDKGLLYIVNSSDKSSVYFKNQLIDNSSKLTKFKILNDDIYLIFNDKISKIENDRIVDIINEKYLKENLKIDFDSIIDFEKNNDLYFILTSDYKLLMFDLINLKGEVIGDQDIGKVKLLKKDNRLFIIGSDTLTYIDLTNRIFKGNYQRLNSDIHDIMFIDNDVYLLNNDIRGYEIWLGKIK
jgi:triacylglycerol esterase/lipase EstA (alpha/beta hydrolase family)